MRQCIVVIVAFSVMNLTAIGVQAAPVEKAWTVDGATRKALIHVPSGTGKSPTPVVFAFHGHGGTMQSAARNFGYEKLWPEAVVVYMQGLPTPGRYDPDGKKAGWQKITGDQKDRDLKFFDLVLATLKKDYKIDEKRVYVTGHSNGGAFTYLLWAARPEVFAAVAPSASAGGRNFRDLKPKPALHVAGENDELVSFEVQKRSMDNIRKLNGCESEGKPWAKSGSLVATEYASKKGAPFVSVIYPGTHKFPAEAPALIVRFFKEHAQK